MIKVSSSYLIIFLLPLTLFSTIFVTCITSSSSSPNTNNNNNPFPFNFTTIQPIYDNNGQIEVTWRNVPGTDFSQDWVSIWWYPLKGTYIQYFSVTSSSSGSVIFENIINARHPYYFQYFRGNVSLAQTGLLYPIPHIPMQLRLNPILNDEIYEDENSLVKMMISWTSDRVSNDACVMISNESSNDMKNSQIMMYYYVKDTHQVGNVSTYTATELNQLVKLPPIKQRTQMYENIASKTLRCGWLPAPRRSNGYKEPCWSDPTAVENFVDPGFFLSVTVPGLKPNTKYYYQVGECKNQILSKTRSFVTKPLARKKLSSSSSQQNQVSVIYFADVGIGPIEHGFEGGALHNDIRMLASEGQAGGKFVFKAMNQKINEQQQTSLPFTLAILNGDVSYSRGWPFIAESFHNWTSSLNSSSIFDRIPNLVTFGNHDRDFLSIPFALARSGDSGGEAGLEIGRRFLPNKPDFLEKPFYSVRHGPILFVALSTEHKCHPQVDFLNSLKVNRTITPWLVVNLHRPLYSLELHDNATFPAHLEKCYADVFTNIGVDVVIQAHQHQYARYCGISSGSCSKTWGYRDIYEKYENVAITPQAQASCFLKLPPRARASSIVSSSNECRVACNKNPECTGVQWTEKSKSCSLLRCKNLTIGENVMQFIGVTIFSLKEKIRGKTGPVYIVDGAGGAQYSLPIIQYDPRVIFSSVDKFGYSTMIANETTFHWQHFNARPMNQLADDLILEK